MTPPVRVVIVTYNSRGEIDAALEGARRCVDAGLIELVVVDNASPDRTEEYVRERHPWVNCIQSGGNIGYGRGCNLGAKDARTPYLFFQNPDAVVEPEAMATLVRFLEQNPRAGIIGPAVVSGDRLQHAGGMMTPRRLLTLAAGRTPRDDTRRDIIPGGAPFRTDHVCGVALMIRRELFESLSGFDPRIFLYFDESDLCLRVAQRGVELWAVGEAVARHRPHASALSTGRALVGGCIAEHYYRSRYYFLSKHFGWPTATVAEGCELMLQAARLVWYAARRRPLDRVLTRFRAPILRMPAQPQ